MDLFVLGIGLGLAAFVCLQFARHRTRKADHDRLKELFDQVQRRRKAS